MFAFAGMVFGAAVMLLFAVPLKASPLANRDLVSGHPFGPLTFGEDGIFQISVFEDLHFGENAWDQWGPQQDINSVKVINQILDKECPGLVVLNGDLITGNNAFLENSTVYIDQIVSPLVSRNLTWASTYGNHDYDLNISGEAILQREKQWDNCRTCQMFGGPDAGTSNYYLPVYARDCVDELTCRPQLLLWFFDSRGGFKYQQQDASGNKVGQPNWVDGSVVDWFEQTNNRLTSQYGGGGGNNFNNNNNVIPSLAFVHIPPYASYALQDAGVDPNRQPGINDDDPLAPQAEGWCPDGRDDGSCAYGGQDAAFMRAVSRTRGLVAVFSGHDHGDTWCYNWGPSSPAVSLPDDVGVVTPVNDVALCFGQHSGYGGYGNWERGSRQIAVSGDGKGGWQVQTWIRLESGVVVGNVTLNETYGRDWYPKTDDTMTNCPTCIY